jgi:hypothetical protein
MPGTRARIRSMRSSRRAKRVRMPHIRQRITGMRTRMPAHGGTHSVTNAVDAVVNQRDAPPNEDHSWPSHGDAVTNAVDAVVNQRDAPPNEDHSFAHPRDAWPHRP